MLVRNKWQCIYDLSKEVILFLVWVNKVSHTGYLIYFHSNRLYHHDITKQDKTVVIFLEIYCVIGIDTYLKALLANLEQKLYLTERNIKKSAYKRLQPHRLRYSRLDWTAGIHGKLDNTHGDWFNIRKRVQSKDKPRSCNPFVNHCCQYLLGQPVFENHGHYAGKYIWFNFRFWQFSFYQLPWLDSGGGITSTILHGQHFYKPPGQHRWILKHLRISFK